MLKTKEEIINWLNSYGIKNYDIDNDLKVDVRNSVFLSHRNLIDLPIQFNIIWG